MRRQSFFIAIRLLTIVCFGYTTDNNYHRYCNARLQFCVEYPKDLIGQGEPTNGDGQIFLSKDKQTEVRAFGGITVEDFDKIEQEYKTASTDIKVSYKLIKSTWFIFSGIDKKGQIVYRKTVKKKLANYMDDGPREVFQTLMITYPSSLKNLYSSYCDKISKSL
jgi:hypothetical protein